jgi:NADPH:quinone reductase
MRGGVAGVAAGMPPVVIAAAFGGPDVLAVIDEPTAEPGPGEARIEIRAAGVNPIDYKAYSGMFGTDPSQLPMRLGSEAAGVVTAAGPDAVGPAGPVAVGDEVIAFRASGAYAAELVVPAGALVPKPAALD